MKGFRSLTHSLCLLAVTLTVCVCLLHWSFTQPAPFTRVVEPSAGVVGLPISAQLTRQAPSPSPSPPAAPVPAIPPAPLPLLAFAPMPESPPWVPQLIDAQVQQARHQGTETLPVPRTVAPELPSAVAPELPSPEGESLLVPRQG
jgi:hypothetical protein